MNKIIKIDLHEIEQVSGGHNTNEEMCNCMGYEKVEMTLTIIPFGSVTYANVCKDLIANATAIAAKIEPMIKYHYLGCFSQEDGQDQLPSKQGQQNQQKQKGE